MAEDIRTDDDREAAMLALEGELQARQDVIDRLREALRRTESRLSILRHRAAAAIPWGSPGIGEQAEYDEVIGQARRLLEQTPATS